MTVDHETIFTMEATPVKFGGGASAERDGSSGAWGSAGDAGDRSRGGRAGHPERIKGLIEAEGIEVVVYDRAPGRADDRFVPGRRRVRVEHEVDGFVSVGRRLEHRHRQGRQSRALTSAPVMDYVNPPVGEGRSRPRR